MYKGFNAFSYFWISQRKRCGQQRLHMTLMSYSIFMPWEVISSPEFVKWLRDQNSRDQEKVKSAIRALAQGGPSLKRPLVGKIEDSYLANLKELIPMSSNMRILFVFDPSRRAVLLHGGDKSIDFQGWYKKNIPIAELIYEKFLKEEGLK